MPSTTPKEAFNTLKSKFNMQELKMLAFSVGIPFEDLEGNGRSGKALAMVQYSQRHGKFNQLVEEMNAPREDALLSPPPADTAAGNITYNIIHGDNIQGDKVGGDNIEIGSISDSSGLAVGKDSSANVTNQTTTPADPPPTVNKYTFNGPVVGAQFGDGNSIQAQNMAGGDINIDSKEAFQAQLATLEALIKEAIANNEIPADEVDGVQDDIQDATKEVAKKNPNARRLVGRLEYVQDILERSGGVANAAGKAGTAVLQALPIATSLLNAASTLF